MSSIHFVDGEDMAHMQPLIDELTKNENLRYELVQRRNMTIGALIACQSGHIITALQAIQENKVYIAAEQLTEAIKHQHEFKDLLEGIQKQILNLDNGVETSVTSIVDEMQVSAGKGKAEADEVINKVRNHGP